MSCREKEFNIFAVYKPPSLNCDVFVDGFQRGVATIKSKNLFICGDFNMNFLEDNSRVQASFSDVVRSLSLLPLITRPTRITETSATLLDNFIVNNPSNITSGILTVDVSDHLPIFILCKNFFGNCTGRGSEARVSYRLINEYSLEKLRRSLYEYNFDSVLEGSNEESIEELTKVINDAYDICCPRRSKILSPKSLTKPWVDHEILILIRKRNSYFVLFRQGKVSKKIYTDFRNFVTHRIRKAKRQYFRHIRVILKKRGH